MDNGLYFLGPCKALSYQGKFTFLRCYGSELFRFDGLYHSEAAYPSSKNKNYLTRGMNDYDIRLASRKGYLNILKSLLERRRKLPYGEYEGPFEYKYEQKKEEEKGTFEQERLREKREKFIPNTKFDSRDAIILASEAGHLAIVRFLFENGYDWDNGMISIEKACAAGHLEIVKYLFGEKGVEVVDEQILEPAFAGGIEVVKYFVDKIGVKLSTEDIELGLEIAIKKDNLDLVKYLVGKGAEVVKRDKFILAALFSESYKVIDFLLSKGVDIRSKGCAFFNKIFPDEVNSLKLVKYLVSKGADIILENNFLLERAIYGARLSDDEFETFRIIEFLVREGVDLKSVIEFYKEEEDLSVYKYLYGIGANLSFEKEKSVSSEPGDMSEFASLSPPEKEKRSKGFVRNFTVRKLVKGI